MIQTQFTCDFCGWEAYRKNDIIPPINYFSPPRLPERWQLKPDAMLICPLCISKEAYMKEIKYDEQ